MEVNHLLLMLWRAQVVPEDEEKMIGRLIQRQPLRPPNNRTIAAWAAASWCLLAAAFTWSTGRSVRSLWSAIFKRQSGQQQIIDPSKDDRGNTTKDSPTFRRKSKQEKKRELYEHRKKVSSADIGVLRNLISSISNPKPHLQKQREKNKAYVRRKGEALRALPAEEARAIVEHQKKLKVERKDKMEKIFTIDRDFLVRINMHGKLDDEDTDVHLYGESCWSGF